MKHQLELQKINGWKIKATQNVIVRTKQMNKLLDVREIKQKWAHIPINISRTISNENMHGRKKPSVPTNAIRFLFCLFLVF